MKVACEPITLLMDPPRCELTVLTGGVRIAMTGEEATAFWAELGDALKKIYSDQPERCPSKFADFLRRELAANRQTPTAVEHLLEGVIAYARRPCAAPDSRTDSTSLVGGSISQPPRPAPGVLGRAIEKLTRR